MLKISFKKFHRYIIISLLVIWIIITIHIFYVYTYEYSKKVPFKWGTIVEWGIKNIHFLPYTSISDDEKFYQSLLFKWCLTPYVSWTSILLKEDLCKIETNNYKTFKVYLNKNYLRSDHNPITLEDIYFTYNDIIKNNKFNLPTIPDYKLLKVNLKNDYIEVDFPYPSIDNKIFFTNFILPKHILQNKDSNRYLNEYIKNLVNSKKKTKKKQINSFFKTQPITTKQKKNTNYSFF